MPLPSWSRIEFFSNIFSHVDPTVQIHVTQIALLGQVGVVVLSHAAAVTKLKLEIVQL